MDLSELLSSINEIENEIDQERSNESKEDDEGKSYKTKVFNFNSLKNVLNDIEFEENIDKDNDVEVNQYYAMYILNNVHQYLKINDIKPVRYKQWKLLFNNNRELSTIIIEMPIDMLTQVFTEYIKYKRKVIVPKIYKETAEDALRHIEIYYENHMKKSISLISEKNIAKLASKYRYRIKTKYKSSEIAVKMLVNVGYLVPIFEYTEYGFNRLIIPSLYVDEYLKNGFEYDNTDDWWAESDDFESILCMELVNFGK